MFAARSLLFALAASALAACNALPKQPGQEVLVLSANSELAASNPADVVVAPLVFPEGVFAKPPATSVRRGFQRALIKRRYTPLALEYVDEQAVEASYAPGAVREDAVLEIIVHSWDDSLWDVRTALVVDLEARLVGAERGAEGTLWSGRLNRRFDFPGDRTRFTTQKALLQNACDRIAEDLLAKLPARNTRPQ